MTTSMEFAINDVTPNGFVTGSRIFPAPDEPLFKKATDDLVPQEIKDWFVRTGITATFVGAVHIGEGIKVVYAFDNRRDTMMFKLAWG